MSSSDVAIAHILDNEGGFEDNLADPGGATNFGISLRFLRGLSVEALRRYGLFKAPDQLGVEDIRELTVDQAKLIYKGEFWEKAPFDNIKSPYVTNYVFDMAVLHGIGQAIKLVQRALWACYGVFEYVLDDGDLGAKTLVALNNVPPSTIETVLKAIRSEYVMGLIMARPTDGEFLNGWLKRCYRI